MLACIQSDLEAATEAKEAAESSAAALEADRNVLQQVWCPLMQHILVCTQKTQQTQALGFSAASCSLHGHGAKFGYIAETCKGCRQRMTPALCRNCIMLWRVWRLLS